MLFDEVVLGWLGFQRLFGLPTCVTFLRHDFLLLPVDLTSQRFYR
jgi:hypothetical protein